MSLPQQPQPSPAGPSSPRGGNNRLVAVVVTIVAVVVLAVGIFAIWGFASGAFGGGKENAAAPSPTVSAPSASSSDAPSPSADASATPSTPGQSGALDLKSRAIVIGDGKEVVDTYVDFMCPVCNQFETIFGPQLQQLAADGKITLRVHPVAILDRYSQGTRYSTRSAQAAFCVASEKPSSSVAFMNALFEGQPEENTPGLSNEQLIKHASTAGADISACMGKGSFASEVDAGTKALPADASGSRGTPTVVINGEYISLRDLSESPTYFTDRFGK